MRKLLLLTTLFISSISLKAQPLKADEQIQVQQTITKLFDGIAELDFAKIGLYTTKDLIILENGAVWNMDSITHVLSPLKTMNFKRANDLRFLRTEVKGNTAWAIYNNTADMSINGQQMKINWLESAVLVKEDKEWRVQLLHSTTLTRH